MNEIKNNNLSKAEEIEKEWPGHGNMSCRLYNLKKSTSIMGWEKYLFEDGSSIVIGQKEYYILGKGVSLREYLWEVRKCNAKYFFIRVLEYFKVSFTTKEGFKRFMRNILYLSIAALVIYLMWGRDTETSAVYTRF